jgi:uncharacterized protein with HEPN domain
VSERLDENAPDVPFLWEMHEAGLGIIRLSRGCSFEEFCGDPHLIESTERAMSIIGRAARNVSAPTRDAHTEVDWRQFIGMARLLGDTDDALEPEELWKALRAVPAMVRGVSAIMPAEDEDPFD